MNIYTIKQSGHRRTLSGMELDIRKEVSKLKKRANYLQEKKVNAIWDVAAFGQRRQLRFILVVGECE